MQNPQKNRSNPETTRPAVDRRFSVAPMMEWTTPAFRYFARLLSKEALLYTEMVTTGAILFGKDPDRFLAYNDEEHPLALQLGGSDPEQLAKCSGIATDFGYDEINLNVGCPSDRVQNNLMGACLMAHKELVAECVSAMQAATAVEVTVKCRIGIDDQNPEETLPAFIETVAAAGCKSFTLHARKAWLKGLSPKENREVPPLDYDLVYRIKQAYPELEIVINGGISTFDQMNAHLEHVDGVMIGREAYQNPYLLAEVDQKIFGKSSPIISRHEALRQMLPYIEQELSKGCYLGHITRHLLGIFQACPGGRKFRRHISENAYKNGAGAEVLEQAMALVSEQAILEAALSMETPP
ncbi:tRNA dihydrouridine(20/20a) synthase DusA [Oceanospirillum maris]|uniref:tRNA dihydrouridine(20/20a) synthase DusA n=1 Tax=Oceanospirillum maris TaxID=64977 RepID=UPI0003FD6E6F|nr:tRNA dihydrouridine(20/20a) synthase DusA [Oceanospirillum maris]